MKSIKLLFAFLLVGCLISCQSNIVKVPDSPYPISNDSFTMDTIAQGFTIPYGIAIVEDNEYFITDRIGKMFHFKNGTKTEITGMPQVVTFGISELRAILHGGLMDVSIHPNYPTNSWIYISYLDSDGLAKVSRLKIQNNAATQLETIFQTRKTNYTGNGMRIIWEDDTHFFLNVGNSNFSTSTNPVLNAQDLNDDAGKIHRLMEDGSIPSDNPIFEGFTSPTTIWSYGHRDVQGLYYEKTTHTLFGVEHGPKGGDELNIIEKGKNYGWPLFSYGINYDGATVSTISKDSAAVFTVLPEHYWTVPTHDGGQAVAPACLLKVNGSTISDWNDYFLFGSLAYRRLMKYNRETNETYGLDIEGRVRTLKQLPSGDILALIERNNLNQANGQIVRIKN
ncbi:glucose/arabinose dehydrogenase [Saonia flava]|uniref:Glucose/arabinose dehydrogenase n=1 Tax=Saonia flava TaxID=523696 RepID=A0A846QZK0_9FLAO|nr:PQQ-dependent sugar dehydrogenase [Saonia flava]NJB72082.1 glucose/arabinose dehydrogenase [Saonia flava]